MIWVKREGGNFFGEAWTGGITLNGKENFPSPRVNRATQNRVIAFPGCCVAPSARSRASSTRYDLRRGALLSRGPSCFVARGSRLCGAAQDALHRGRDTKLSQPTIPGRAKVVSKRTLFQKSVLAMPLKEIDIRTEPHSFMETNKQHEKRISGTPDREDVSKWYFHTRFACVQIGSSSSCRCRQDCRQ